MRFFQTFHPLVWIILGGTVFTRTASFMAMPFLALYLHNDLHAHPILIGITIGVAPLIGTIGGFIGGVLTDRYGRKKIILSAIFVWSCVFIGFALTKVTFLFIVLNALNGLCGSFFEPATQALMSDFTPKEKRKRLFSFRYAAINIGAVIGPLLGVYIAVQSSQSLTFLITGGMYFIYGIFLLFILNRYPMQQTMLSKSIPFKNMLSIVLSNKTLVAFIFGAILLNIGYSQINSTLPQYLEISFEDGVKLFSVLIALNASLVILLQLPLSLLTERFSMKKSLLVGIVLFATGFFLFAFSTNNTGIIMGMVCITVAEILAFPLMNTVIDQIAPETQRATYLGTAQLQKLGSFLGPIIGGTLLGYLHGQLFSFIAAVILLSTIFYLFGFRRLKMADKEL